MSSSSPWLNTLLRVREHRHDAALQSLAQSLQAAETIRDTAVSVETALSGLRQAHRQNGQSGHLDSERLRQLRQERDDLQSQREFLTNQQQASDAVVQQNRKVVAAKDAEAEVLRRLQDRLDSAHRQAQRRQQEQSSVDVTVSLCNGRLSG